MTPPDPLEPFWGEEHPNGRGLTSAELTTRLQEFTFQFSGGLQAASLAMCAASDDLQLRRSTILWRSRMVPEVRRAATHDDPLEAYIDTWTLCVQQQLFFQTPEAEQFFGDQTPTARGMADLLEQEIEKLGTAFMSREHLERARQDVRDFARENPFKTGWSRQGNLPSTAGDPEFAWIINNPFSLVNPFRGLDSGARAIMEFTKVADDFKTMVGHMPEELSWKLELLLTEAEERGRLRQLNESMAGLSESSVRMAATAERLPDEVHGVIDHTFDELDAQYEPLQATLAELDGTVDGASELVAALDRTLERAVLAGEAWEAVFSVFAEDEEAAPVGSDGPSFAEEWDTAARSVTAAAAEIRAGLADVRELSTSEDTDAVILAASAASRSALDHAAWRVFQLILAALGAALVYLFVRSRLQRPA